MSMMAHLTVTAGPDAGREFIIDEELVHIGKGEENHFRLADDALADHQASIAQRTGRYAIYVPAAHQATVDGNELPAEKWVWLPSSATICLGPKTQVRFAADVAASKNGAERPEPPKLPADASRETVVHPGADTVHRSAQSSRRKGTRSAGTRTVAKFITDRPDVALVKLGEDGKLPELRLNDASRPAARRDKKNKSPLLLYGVLGFSFALSLGMLLVNPGSQQVSSSAQEEARAGLVEFYGEEGAEKERYQQLLRQASIDHSRGDFEAERRAYGEVLRMLNAADILDKANPIGLTGKQTGRGRASDEELRRHLQILLAR
jgi:hypothetical protein